MIRVYYNEIDDYCCAWLSNLMDAGIITPGKIDDRSIEDVCPDELMGYSRVHMYAGIGIWDYALNQAAWGDREVWTASCPCQPFSAAGKGAGFADERHLWPASFHLIAERKPATIFGEQVASKAVEPWIDLVHADLEAMGYAFGCVPFPAAGVGAPHIRDRAYWVANSIGNGSQRGISRRQDSQREIQHGQTGRDGAINGVVDANDNKHRAAQRGCDGTKAVATTGHGAHITITGKPSGTSWDVCDWVECRDGKLRPVESGTFPLAPRSANHVGRLRAYGNSINAQAAKEFITAYMEI